MNRKSMSAFVQRVCALVAVGVLCATGPAARAQEKPATAGTEKPAATTDVERLLALPWADMREKVTRHPYARPWETLPKKDQEAFEQRVKRALAELTKRQGEVYRQIDEGKIEEAYPTVFDMHVLLAWLTNYARGGQAYKEYFEPRAEVLLDAAGKDRRAAQVQRVEEAVKKYHEEAQREYASVVKAGIEANPEWAAAGRRLKEIMAKLETLKLNIKGEPKDSSRKLTAEETAAAVAAAKEYREAETTLRQFKGAFDKNPENKRLQQAADSPAYDWMMGVMKPGCNREGMRERIMCYTKLGGRGPDWLLAGRPDPAPDAALPRIDESGRKPGTAKTMDLGGGVKLELTWIPPGEFMMGSPTNEPGRSFTERLHRVKLTKGFWMGKYEVTQEQWQQVMGDNPSWFKNAGPRAPVETVRFDQVQKFMRKLSEKTTGKEGGVGGKFRLPTEAEWEWACRAGATTALDSGKMTIKGGNNSPELSAVAWYAGNSGVDYEGAVLSALWADKEYNHHSAGTHPVGQKQPNAWGLYDMLGNVGEWCEDWSYAYPAQAVTDPTGPKGNMGDSGMGEHVVRGGSYRDGVRLCRSAARSFTMHEYCWCNATIGFRVVLDDPPAGQEK